MLTAPTVGRPRKESVPAALLADHDGRPIDEPPGLRHPSLSEEIARDFAVCGNDTLPDAPADALIDAALRLSGEAPDRAKCLVALIAEETARESEAVRLLSRLLANQAFELAGAFMSPLIPRITTPETLVRAIDRARRECYRHIASEPCQSVEDLERLCLRFSASARQLHDARFPLRVMRVIASEDVPGSALPGSRFTIETLRPSPPFSVAENGALVSPRLPEAAASSGDFVCLSNVRASGGRPHLLLNKSIVDDALLRHADPREFTPYGQDTVYFRRLYHYCELAPKERWAIVADTPATRRIERGILLNGPYQSNFYHWLAEYLTLLPAINALPSEFDEWPLIVCREAFAHPNLLAALRLAMAPHPRRVEILELDEVASIDSLIVPPRVVWMKACLNRVHVDGSDLMLAASAVRALHGLLALPGHGTRRFFVARRGNTRLRNQEETRQLFEQFGFETIYPETLDFDAGRALFSQAQMVAGPPGSAFANLLLCPANTLGIVLMPDIGPEAAPFSSIAGPLGQTLVNLCGPTDDPNVFQSTFIADLERVSRFLERLEEMTTTSDAIAPTVNPGSDRGIAAASERPLVSILIPSFKPRWFEEALRSAVAQDYPNTEILVFDNCPTEDIRDICARYPRVTYYRNPNMGPQNSLDIAAASRGRYIKHLFDDDLLEPTCVSELVAAIEAQPEARMAFGASWMIDENGLRMGLRQQVETPAPVHYYDGNALCRAFARDCANMIGEFSSVLFDGPWLRSDVLQLRRQQASNRELFGLCDVVCFMNASAGRPVAFVNKPLTSFRFNRESNSNPDRNPDYVLAITDWRLIIEEAELLGTLSVEDVGVARNSYNNQATRLAECHPALAGTIHPTLFRLDELPEHEAFLKSEALAGAGRHDEAIALLIRLGEKNTAHWKVFQRLAEHALSNHDLPLALTLYGKATQKAGHPAKENIAYARLLVGAGREAEAETILRRYLDHFPDDGDVRGDLASCAEPAPPLVAQNAASIPDEAQRRYSNWLIRRELGSLQPDDYRNRVRTLWKIRPLFEIMLFLRAGDEPLLADSIDSLTQQYYDGWRLSIFASMPSPEAEFTREDSAVRWIQLAADDSIADVANARLQSSPADWVGFFECGTQFAADMLLACGDNIALHPHWRLIYTDEDALGADGIRHKPLFKPDFNLELLRSTDYVGSAFVERKALISAGGYSRLADAASYDLILRIADACGERAVGHIPEVLHHVPTTAFRRASTEGAATALRDHLARGRIDAEIFAGLIEDHTRRVLYHHPGTPKVSIVVPTRNGLGLLQPCVESLFRHTAYSDWELLLVDNGSDDPAVLSFYNALKELQPERVSVLTYLAPFNFSAMNNLAARHARGNYLLLLNNDTECIHEDWLEAMMAHAQRPDVGVVGARLLYPDSLKVQHAGVVLGLTGTAGHVFAGELSHADPGYLDRAQADQEYCAVTGACLLIRRALYEEIGGLDEQDFGTSFNDIDLCLKVRQQGYRVIWTPFATLLHHGSATQRHDTQDPQKNAAFQRECNTFYQRWTSELVDDPAWNRNLSLVETTPAIEEELAVPWHREFRDRPRVAAMPVVSNGAAEYRCLTPLRALHAAGKVHYASVCQPRPGFDRAPMPVELARMAPDTLLLHAPVDNVRCQALLRYQRFNPEVFRIYTLDDLITNIPESNPTYRVLPADAMAERLALGLKASHRLIVSTVPLAEACRHLIDDIRVVPNTLEWSVWGSLRSRRRRGPRPRVGWAGAQQHAGDLAFLQEVVEATHRDVDWIFLGMAPEGLHQYIAEAHGYVHDFSAYPAKLASLDLDLAIAPLELHPFNEAKSNLRLLEYGALGWPVICTDILPYCTGNPPVTRLPNDATRWIAAIRERAADPDALAREGDALRDWVQRQYQLEKHLDLWLQALLP